MSDNLIRTFISLNVPDEVKKVAAGLKSKVLAKHDKIKWIKLENIHLTLRFVGPTTPEEVIKINSLLNEVVKNYKVFSLKIINAGCYPKIQRPRVLWLGVNGEVSILKDLVSFINKNLENLGYPYDKHDYSPHITIGRISYPQKITQDLSSFIKAHYSPVKMNVTKILFFRSETLPTGSIYSLLGTHHLSIQ